MDKLKKVIRGLEMSYTYSNVDEDNTLVPQQLVLDAIALLKAQEPVEPIYGEDNYIRCGKCKHHIVGIIAQDTGNVMQIQKYCSECGQAVKWK